jgi:hypothetical protein
VLVNIINFIENSLRPAQIAETLFFHTTFALLAVTIRVSRFLKLKLRPTKIRSRLSLLKATLFQKGLRKKAFLFGS